MNLCVRCVKQCSMIVLVMEEWQENSNAYKKNLGAAKTTVAEPNLSTKNGFVTCLLARQIQPLLQPSNDYIIVQDLSSCTHVT